MEVKISSREGEDKVITINTKNIISISKHPCFTNRSLITTASGVITCLESYDTLKIKMEEEEIDGLIDRTLLPRR
jgi:hypothetical protein